jgi:hypothetical protein
MGGGGRAAAPVAHSIVSGVCVILSARRMAPDFARFAPSSAPKGARGWSAGRRAFKTSAFRRDVHDADASPSGTPPRRCLTLARSSGLGVIGADCARSRIRRGFARLHPSRVQPLKAAPHSEGGRDPKASRVPAG